MAPQIVETLLFDDVAVATEQADDDTTGSLANSTEVRGVVAVE